MTHDQWLHAIAACAVQLERQTKCPAPLMVAQAAVESAWGQRPIGKANYFGIKRAARHTQWCTVLTREVIHGQSVMEHLEFADYDNLEAACADFAWLITRGAPYAAAWQRYQQTRDLEGLIAAVARTYASDPGYARLVGEVAHLANVRGAIEAAAEVVA
jgi:flagellar protein FlgJ